MKKIKNKLVNFRKNLTKDIKEKSKFLKNEWFSIIYKSIKKPLMFQLFVILLYVNRTHIKVSEELIITSTTYLSFLIAGWALFRISNLTKDKVIQDLNEEYKKLTLESDEDRKRTIKYKTTFIDAMFKIINFASIIIIVLIFLQKIGLSLSGILAFGGMSGIILGFACKDFLSNFFGGLMIYTNKMFYIGDWIKLPERTIEGVVEEIGWLMTKIMTFDRRPIYIPNSIFANIVLENPSRMTHRKINESFNIELDDVNKFNEASKICKALIKEHDGIDDELTVIFNISSFANGYALAMLSCYTKTTQYENYHSIKQDVLIKINNTLKEKGINISKNTLKLIKE